MVEDVVESRGRLLRHDGFDLGALILKDESMRMSLFVQGGERIVVASVE